MASGGKDKDGFMKEAMGATDAYATALSFIGTLLAFTAIGYFIDRWAGTRFVFLLVGLVLGFVGGGYKLVREANKLNAPKRRKRNDGTGD